MKELVVTAKFEKELRLMVRRGKDISKIQVIIQLLENEIPLDAKYKAHKLKGNFVNTMECHIEPDWLLIWQNKPDAIYLLRTGTHSDLF